MLWKKCLLETKNQFESAEILYRLARAKFLLELNKSLLLQGFSNEEISKSLTFTGCVNQSEAKMLAYRS